MAWLGITGAVVSTLKNAFRKPFTVQFPEVVRPRPPRYRASFALLKDNNGEEACVACLLCEKVCPSAVIKIKAGPKKESPFTGKKRQYAEDFTLDLTACLQCELCIQVCPQDAIVMVNRPEVPTYSREELFLTMDRLYTNGTEAAPAWANATRLLEMQEPPKPPAPPPAAAKPADAKPAAAPAAAPAQAPASTEAAAPVAAVIQSAAGGATAPAPVQVQVSAASAVTPNVVKPGGVQ